MIRVHTVVTDSSVDGPGLRLAVYTQGCPHCCPGCHNPQTHDPAAGTDLSPDEILARLNPLLSGVTISGGEPLLQAAELLPLARRVKELGRNLWLYTGYTWEEILQNPEWLALVSLCDTVVDGRFEQEKRSLELRFRGSSNQRIIDVARSLIVNS
jgi:anaerobic ribonucleoside-triphosphate reductase activating protein